MSDTPPACGALCPDTLYPCKHCHSCRNHRASTPAPFHAQLELTAAQRTHRLVAAEAQLIELSSRLHSGNRPAPPDEALEQALLQSLVLEAALTAELQAAEFTVRQEQLERVQLAQREQLERHRHRQRWRQPAPPKVPRADAIRKQSELMAQAAKEAGTAPTSEAVTSETGGVEEAVADSAEGHSSGGTEAPSARGTAELKVLRVAMAEAEAAHERSILGAQAERAREVSAVRHRCRSLLVARDGEVRRLQEALALAQQQLHALASTREAAATASDRSHHSAEPLAQTEEGLRATARQQALSSSESEKWKARATSLEARLRGASDARRAWGLREAELLEKLEEKERLLQVG